LPVFSSPWTAVVADRHILFQQGAAEDLGAFASLGPVAVLERLERRGAHGTVGIARPS
jgi:hypothetical protein